MKITLLVIEFGIKNIDVIKRQLKFEFVDVIYATSFLDVVDTIYQRGTDIIVFSDYRGEMSTIGYIKMFKRTNPDFKLVLVSNDKVIDQNRYSYLLQKEADAYISSFDVDAIKGKIVEYYEKGKSNIRSQWKNSTKDTIMYLKINFKNKQTAILKDISDKTGHSISTICHNIVLDTGKSVVDWLTYYRVEGAKELLLKTNFPIKYVGEMVGYRSIQGFIKSFKKIENTTPKLFRYNNRTTFI